MARFSIEDTTLTDIANSIRAQMGSAEPIAVTDMATQIRSIEGGGGGVGIDEVNDILDKINGEPIGDRVLGSGMCGDNATWLLKDNGDLLISGTGVLTSSPWVDVPDAKTIIKNLEIENGITNPIGGANGYLAFNGCENLVSANIPNAVEYLPVAMFAGCKSLQHIVIPASVSFINSQAFAGCSSLRVVFAGAASWKIVRVSTTVKTLSVSNSTDPEVAAKYLTEDYADCQWIKI